MKTYAFNSPDNTDWLHRVSMSYGCIIMLFIFILLYNGVVPIEGQELSRPQEQQTTPVQPTPDPITTQLQKEKLGLEVEKLRIENENNDRNLSNWRGWRNLLYNNVTILAAIILGFWGLYRYLRERREELQKREDERFEAIVKGLGGEHEQERISAAGLLPTFLRPGYERFYVQVFNLVAGNLRMGSINNKEPALPSAPTPQAPLIQSPLRVTLATVLREAYPRAREAILEGVKSASAPDTGRYLNATGVQLDETHLAGANLEDAWLRQASLQGATLTSAKLTNANLEESKLSGAHLEQADLRGASLKDADFTGANLEYTNLSNARADNAVFRNAKLSHVTMHRAIATGADFLGADLTEGELIGVDFTPSQENPKKANPEAAEKLTKAQFMGVVGLTDDQIAQCKEKGAVFPSGE
jgi:uncharacterized protein YjbI with pentapeptide repeats